MNKNILWLFLCLLVIFSCKENEEISRLNSTELEIKVLNANGQAVPNANVQLFRNLRDLESLKRKINSGRTGGNGTITFKDLQPVNYFFYASYVENGTLHSNYGSFSNDISDFGSNYELADYLTENAITRISISTLFSRPVNPNQVYFNSLDFFYIGEDEFILDNPSRDTTEIYFLLIQDFNPNQDLNAQLGNVFGGNSNLFSDKTPSSIGDGLSYSIDALLDIAFVRSTQQTDGSFSPHYKVIPAFFDQNSNTYSFADDYSNLVLDINASVISLVDSETFIKRNYFTDFYIGNDTYTVDVNLEWR